MNPEKACFIILKAREYDAKVEPVDSEPGSSPADDQTSCARQSTGLMRTNRSTS
ncbi:MAG TPA: hypothetical protein VN832_07330 [Stellaceae bacterium]|nr:hypothetical protein [Stellaceae bacterium]